MIVHKNLKEFLKLVYIKDLDFSTITETELRKHFKNNEYYNLKRFCLDNELIIIEFKGVNLTLLGLDFFNILKRCSKI